MAGGAHVLQTIVEIAGSVSSSLENAVKSTTGQLNKIDLKAAAVAASVTAGFIGIGNFNPRTPCGVRLYILCFIQSRNTDKGRTILKK